MTVLGVTLGCPAGVGPEVMARAIVEANLSIPGRADADVVVYAPAALVLEGARRAKMGAVADGDGVVLGRGSFSRRITCQDPGVALDELAPGVVTASALAFQAAALQRLLTDAAAGRLDAVVTGPVRKAALVYDGVAYAGQTEVAHHHLATDAAREPLMVFVGGPFVLGLLTVHVPLRDVADLVTAARCDDKLAALVEAARALTGNQRPRVVALGLNPHAGEGGLLGTEERDVLVPAVRSCAARSGASVEGPVPADGFFADLARGQTAPDAVLATSHDQGLGPYKLLCGGEGVNLTWGLRRPRTSPDHGTADRLAGLGQASSLSCQRSLEVALRLARRSGAGPGSDVRSG